LSTARRNASRSRAVTVSIREHSVAFGVSAIVGTEILVEVRVEP
jgi:hypothetical protein